MGVRAAVAYVALAFLGLQLPHTHTLAFRMAVHMADPPPPPHPRHSHSSRAGFLHKCFAPLGEGVAAAISSASHPLSASALSVQRTEMQVQYELFKSAMYQVNAGQFEMAEQIYSSIIDQFNTPSSIDGSYRTLLARAYSDRGNTRMTLLRLDQALVDYSHALTLEPTYPEFWVNRALAYEERGNMLLSEDASAINKKRQFVEFALDDYEHAVVLNPNDCRLHVNLGDALSSLGRHDEALESYRRAMNLEPRNPVNFAKVALTEVQVGNVDRAWYMLEVLLRKNPGYAEMHLAHASLLWCDGNFAEAADEYNYVISEDPRLNNVKYLESDLRWPPVMVSLYENLRTAGVNQNRYRNVDHVNPFTAHSASYDDASEDGWGPNRGHPAAGHAVEDLFSYGNGRHENPWRTTKTL